MLSYLWPCLLALVSYLLGGSDMRVLFGNMEFGYFCVGKDTGPMCVVHSIQAVLDLENEDAADSLLSKYDSYIIPELTKCEITYAPGVFNSIVGTN